MGLLSADDSSKPRERALQAMTAQGFFPVCAGCEALFHPSSAVGVDCRTVAIVAGGRSGARAISK